MRIAIDIDSTLHHYWDQFAEIAHRRFGVDLPYDEQVDWNNVILKPHQLRLCLEETHCAQSIAACEPYPKAVEIVGSWHEAGHFIHITSHRPPATHPATEQWLQRIELPYDELRCDWDKVPHCKEIGIELLIDDSPVNIRAAVDAGLVVATIAHPWNADVCEDEDVIRAADWAELAERLAPQLLHRAEAV